MGVTDAEVGGVARGSGRLQPAPTTRQPRTRAGLLGRLRRFAGSAPVRVFVVAGSGYEDLVDAVRLRPDVRILTSPRSATILLVTGYLPHAFHAAVKQVHDAVAHPRGVVVLSPPESPQDAGIALPSATILRVAEPETPQEQDRVAASVAEALHDVQLALSLGERGTDPALLPDVDPAPWRGVGPYKQGGTGMTGGVPYGRPLAGRATDRDGLELDQLPLRIGPFFAAFPDGLVLDVRLQGDVLQAVNVPGNAYADIPEHERRSVGRNVRDAFEMALQRPVSLAWLEYARARHHLRWLSTALRIHGLPSLSLRVLRFSGQVAAMDAALLCNEIVQLGRMLERIHLLAMATANVGRIESDRLKDEDVGPVTRAAGIARDARSDDATYRSLGFEPLVQSDPAGDARARWRQRLAEALQSIELCRRAGTQQVGGNEQPLEAPRGRISTRDGGVARPAAVLLTLLPQTLVGLEWGDAVTAITSLDLDMRAAAPLMTPLSAPPAPATNSGMSDMSDMTAMKHPSPAMTNQVSSGNNEGAPAGNGQHNGTEAV